MGTRAKRAREASQECPICFEPTKHAALRRSFDCVHAVCRACDDQLFVRRSDSCPTCRAPRRRDSEQAQTVNNKRRRAETVPEMGEQPSLIFLPIPPGPGLQDFLQAMLTAPRVRAVGGFLNSDPVQAAISALVNADALSLDAFHRETRTMRTRTQQGARTQGNSGQ